MSLTQTDDLDTFVNRYCGDLDKFATQYPDQTTYVVDESDLAQYDIELADWLKTNPQRVLGDLRTAIVRNIRFDQDLDDLRIAISPTNSIDIDELRSKHLGRYLAIRGRVSSISEVKPKATQLTFECKKGDCRKRETMEQFGHGINEPPVSCPMCERKANWEIVDGEYVDGQTITLTSTEPKRATPNEIRVVALADQVNTVDAGDTAIIAGIYRMDGEATQDQATNGFVETQFDTKLIEREGNNFDTFDTDKIDSITALADREDIDRQIIDSIAPEIHGHRQIKLALALQLFGGVTKTLPTGTERVGDINILLVGDPGTGKSVLIKTMSRIAPKSVFASGKGATAAGLTATAKQTSGGDWTLEAGALVLASGGIAAIDEFDKMEDSARKSMHEALEGRQIPVNKAGINTVLPARCGVIAGANPVGEQFNPYDNLTDQIKLGPALITRFDLVFTMQDTPDTDRDRQIAETQFSDGDSLQPAIETELLQEYIAYARQEIHPEWTESAKDRAIEYFTDIRERSESNSPVTPRINDDIRKLAEAAARMRLSKTISTEDVERAITLKNEHIGDIAMDEDGFIDGSKLDGGRVTHNDRIHIVKRIIEELGDAELDDIIAECDERGIGEKQVTETIDKLSQRGAIYEPEMDTYRVA